MPILTEREFAKLAAAAAKDLVDHQVPLNDSIDKLASSHEMNDEQIARLCEATNNAAFNALFEAKGKQGSDDRLVEFDVASPKVILGRRVAAEKTASVRRAAPAAFDAAYESRPLRVAEPFAEKTASETLPETPRELSERQKEANARALLKTLDHLEVEKHAQADAVQVAVANVAHNFRSIYARDGFAAFEKEAMALHPSPRTSALLNSVRQALRMPEATHAFDKVAHMVVMNEKTAAHTAFKEALTAFDRYQKICATLAHHGRS